MTLALALVSMAIAVRLPTPIGPWALQESSAMRASGRAFGRTAKVPVFDQLSDAYHAELGRVSATAQQQIQAGQAPDYSPLRALVGKLEEVLEELKHSRNLIDQTQDFQTLETWLLVQCCGERKHGESMRWQIEWMKAVTDGLPIPSKPAHDGGPSGPSSTSSAGVKASPFVSGRAALASSALVRRDCASVIQQHKTLILMGSRFGTFEPRGQLEFIDALEAVEERWQVLFARFKLMGELNPEYLRQTQACLESMGFADTVYC
jgi:hypothetical protein